MSPNKRPLWANYIVAYFFVGTGVMVIDAASGPGSNPFWFAIGEILSLLGFLVFCAAISNSVHIVLSRKARPRDRCAACGEDLAGNVWDVCPKCGSRCQHCATCGYNLTANVSGVCPECGSKIKI